MFVSIATGLQKFSAIFDFAMLYRLILEIIKKFESLIFPHDFYPITKMTLNELQKNNLYKEFKFFCVCIVKSQLSITKIPIFYQLIGVALNICLTTCYL